MSITLAIHGTPWSIMAKVPLHPAVAARSAASVESPDPQPPEPVAPAAPAVTASVTPPAAAPAMAPSTSETTKPDASANPPDTHPVVRPVPGNWGMVFIFGGLAPLSIAGLNDLPLASGLIFTELGLRRVLKKATVSFSLGAGMAHTSRSGGIRSQTSAGVSGSLAVVRAFRVWRRIAPYAGGFIHTHYIDATGPDNWLVTFSAGPILGLEYYIADRVGLWGSGVIGVGPTFGKNSIQWVARVAVDAGGHFGLAFYF